MITTSSEFGEQMGSNARKIYARFLIDGEVVEGEVKEVKVNQGACGDSAFSVGTVYSSYLTATIDDCPTLLENRELELQIGVELTDGTVEYCTVGFYTASDVATSVGTTTFTGLGRISAKCGSGYWSDNGWPQTVQSALDEIAAQTGVSIDASACDSAALALNIESSMDGLLHREALMYIAGLLGGFATESSDGGIVLRPFGSTVAAEMDADRTTELFEFSDYDYTVTGVEVIVSESGTDEDGNEVEGVSYTYGTPNLTLSNPYMTQALFDLMAVQITGFTYRPGTVPLDLGDIRLEAGDMISTVDAEGVSRTVACLLLEHTFDGGLMTTITAPGESETEQGASFTGSLSAAVEKTATELLVAKQVTATKLEAVQASINELTAKAITAEYLTTNYLTAEDIKGTYATITELTTSYATIEALNATNAAITNLSTVYATIENLNAATANISALTADLASINSLLAGNIGTGTVQTVHLTADNVVIDDAIITDAMIADLSASKLTAGTIYTDKVTIQSESGNLYITDNTIQIQDGTTVRVQIGEDASGDYNLYLWDAAGNLLWDAGGLYAAGIHDGIIKDVAIADDANINESKIDMASVAQRLNEDGSITVHAANVTVDDTTLDYKLTTITDNTEAATAAAEAAQAAAVAAQSTADDAASAAATAASDAAAAQSTADAAKSAADTAQSAADTAQADATAAQSAADAAATAASTAASDAAAAQSTADSAATAAATAQATADAAASDLTQAQADLKTAQDNYAALSAQANATDEELAAAQDAITAAQAALTTAQATANSAATAAATAQSAADAAQADADSAASAATAAANAAATAQSTANTAKANAATAQSAADTAQADAEAAQSTADTAKANAATAQAAAEAAQSTADDAAAAAAELETRTTTLETELSVVQGQITAKVWQTDITEAISGISVGSRNYLPNTRTMDGWTKSSNITLAEDDEGYTVATWAATTTLAWNSISNNTSSLALLFSTVRGQTVTLSFDVRSDDFDSSDTSSTNRPMISLRLRTADSSTRTLYRDSTMTRSYITTDWTRYTLTATLTDDYFTSGSGDIDDTTLFFVAIYNYALTSLQVRKIKLELGTIATDWTPAPEDTETAITTLQDRYSAITQTISGITAEVADLTTVVSDNYETLEGKITTVSETADSISATVSSNYTALSAADTKYGTCSTAASTKAKVVTCSSFTTLAAGATICVYFTYANTATSPTLNVNSTGAKSIYAYGAAIASDSDYNWVAKSYVTFVYNGSQWCMVDAGSHSKIATLQVTADSLTSRVTQTESDISDNATSITTLSSELTQLADSIALCVTTDADTGYLRLGAGDDGTVKFTIEADNLTLDERGNLAMTGNLTVADCIIMSSNTAYITGPSRVRISAIVYGEQGFVTPNDTQGYWVQTTDSTVNARVLAMSSSNTVLIANYSYPAILSAKTLTINSDYFAVGETGVIYVGGTDSGYYLNASGGAVLANGVFSGSLSTYGYTVPRIQHGRLSVSLSATSGTGSVTFTTAFPGTPTVVVSPQHASTSTLTIRVYSTSATGFNYYYTSSSSSLTLGINWIAMYT